MSNNKTKAKLIIFSAPSGAGKSSLIKEVISRSSGNIQLSISATTRPPRDGEEHGRDYFFISDEEFNELKDQNSFIEHANVYGYQYGTLRSFVDEKIENNINVILDIDVQGFDLIRNSINDIIRFKNPLNKTLENFKRPNGLRIKKISTPIGVIGIIYESRPNVTADVSALSLK